VIDINYAELIKSYINKSGYKLDELSELLKKQGISATKEYLSRLQNGKRPPASDELNIALAELTGNDPKEIIVSAYIDKAPENIKGLLSGYFDIFYNNNNLNKQLSYAAYQVRKKFPEFTKGIYKEEELMQEGVYREYKELSKTFFKKHFGESIDITSKERKQYYLKRNLKKPLKVPIINFIKRDEPLYSDKQISNWIYIPNLWELTENKVFLFKVTDNSMENSRIKANDLVVVKVCNEINDGDIVVVNIDDADATLKKIKRIDKDNTWIYTSNSGAFEPRLIEMNRIRIIGKVIQVFVTPM
jgi:SOS-response transcriptional repressor LexA